MGWHPLVHSQELWQRSQRALSLHYDGIDILAFHRRRLDNGPGCLGADDAAHFSVRSPYPTLQLLMVQDLVSALFAHPIHTSDRICYIPP